MSGLKELGGWDESLPNMAPRQNQLWFPVTSLEQQESKEGHGEKDPAERVKNIVSSKIDELFLIVLCHGNRDVV